MPAQVMHECMSDSASTNDHDISDDVLACHACKILNGDDFIVDQPGLISVQLGSAAEARVRLCKSAHTNLFTGSKWHF